MLQHRWNWQGAMSNDFSSSPKLKPPRQPKRKQRGRSDGWGEARCNLVSLQGPAQRSNRGDTVPARRYYEQSPSTVYAKGGGPRPRKVAPFGRTQRPGHNATPQQNRDSSRSGRFGSGLPIRPNDASITRANLRSSLSQEIRASRAVEGARRGSCACGNHPAL